MIIRDPETMPLFRSRFLLLACCALLAGCATSRQTTSPPPRPQQAIVPAAPSPGEPADLAGLKSTQLREVFGAPNFIRKEGTMELWRYDNAGCKAFFFLYPYGQALLVRHVETLPRGSTQAANQTCLDSLHPKSQQPIS
jgi:hypothetical protein